ncbi:MAG: hypothetical protein K0U38_11580 [Epsilonproteobacteria bacterium]|nr:hypothetical protein [Campylobacterota bacterium]
MKEFIQIYREYKSDIESFIITTLKNNGDIIDEDEINHYKKNFNNFPSMELLYITDEHCKQISPNIYRHKTEEQAKDKDRGYLASKLTTKNSSFSISEPYISTATGNTCITVMKKEGEHHVFIDFVLSELLGRLGLVELHPTFDNFTKISYRIIGFSLMFFAFLSVGYAIISYVSHLFLDGSFSLDSLFKPIVAITLGLAIFDLAKTILEREVFYKNYGKESEDAMVLTKFSIAIIIALSIEALMVVFKIALKDYTQMIHAFYLILGVGIVTVALALYNYLSQKKL